jgi:ArsR family transcriptional regulator, arsenate/arsenite/antimonite-responsive transcriptional repressor
MPKLVRAFSALADETRIRILKVLLERDCCVCEVMQALDISQTRASRNLSILENAGFVSSSREGSWVVYFINKHINDCVNSLLQILNTCTEEEIIKLDKERLDRAVRIGCRALKK